MGQSSSAAAVSVEIQQTIMKLKSTSPNISLVVQSDPRSYRSPTTRFSTRSATK
jgi:hypothetical protein